MDYIVRGGNWYFEQLNSWRVLDEVTLPQIMFRTEDFTPGGHVMGVDWPEDMEPLKATIKMKSDDPRVRGLCGRQPGDYVQATYYENMRSFRTGQNKGRIITLKGLINGVKADVRKGVKASGTEYDFSTIVRYEDVYDAQIIHRFDQFEGPGSIVAGGRALFVDMANNLAVTGGTAL